MSRVGVTGASGLVGRALVPHLEERGYEVRALPRRPEHEHLAGLTAVVHLAGEPLYALRWTPAKKRRIEESRAEGTRHLAARMATLPSGPRVLVSMSGVNYYGDRGDEPLSEDSPPGEGFLADVCRAWETATRPAEAAGIRVVHLRAGVVLAKEGGALPKLALPYRLGVGGTVGRPGAWLSWIALDDLVDVIARALEDDTLRGPVNAVAERPVTQRELSRALARALHRPRLVPVPPLLVRAAVGEMGEEVLLASERVLPTRLVERGHAFRHPHLDDALAHVLGESHGP